MVGCFKNQEEIFRKKYFASFSSLSDCQQDFYGVKNLMNLKIVKDLQKANENGVGANVNSEETLTCAVSYLKVINPTGVKIIDIPNISQDDINSGKFYINLVKLY